ncbi:GlxA family transcriptional regulator [Nisaea sp.]|uniref:GlxA family transcriptional regulator n=1 Tax=Nisaea sp. TaxID=2024842 RepID=UPI0032EFD57A
MTRHIEILGFPDCQLLDIAGPLQVFSTANDLAGADGAEAPYVAVVVGRGPDVRTSAGLSLAVAAMGPPDRPLDTVIAAGGVGVTAACEDAELVRWLRDRTRSARRTASVCSGAFLLATAGLLDGRRAVTHWQRCEEFARRFPKVRLKVDPIFVRDGDVWTSAGVTAGIDLALAMVEEDLGRDMALSVARQLVVFLKRPGGQSQFSTILALQGGEGRFDELHAWMQQNLRRRLAIDDLATRAGMSVRSFSRHYRSATGRTPANALEDMRLETARRLLEQNGSVSRVAQLCGFGTEETMRRVFRRRLGASPQEYRERFV